MILIRECTSVTWPATCHSCLGTFTCASLVAANHEIEWLLVVTVPQVISSKFSLESIAGSVSVSLAVTYLYSGA